MNSKLLYNSVIITNTFLLLTGLFFTIYSAIIYANYAESADKQNLFTEVSIFGIVLGVFLILWSIYGFINISKKNQLMQAAYNVGLIMIFLLSIAALVISSVVEQQVPRYKNDEKCISQPILIQLSELNNLSHQTLCQSKCLCNFQGTQEDASKLGISNYDNQYSNPVRVQDCQVFQNFNLENQNKNSSILKFLEEVFGCSGFCSQNSYYLFSDLNDGIPDGDCKVHIINFIEKNFVAFIVSSSILTVFLLSCIILNIYFYADVLKSRYSTK